MDDVHGRIAIVGATIIDGNGGVPVNDGVILIKADRIEAIGDRSIPIPSDAHRIDAVGKFVIPGLMDAYVYLVDGVTPTSLIRYEGRYDELALEAAQVALKNGVTTVFDGWGPRDALIKARDAIRGRRAVGSRIYLCGNFVGLDGPFSDDFIPQYKVALHDPFIARTNSMWQLNVGQRLTTMSPQEVGKEIREYTQSGIDYLSYAISDHRGGATRYIVFSPRVQRVIVEEAHRAGVPVCGFRPATGEAVHLALEAGVDVILGPDCSIDHPLSEEMIALLAQRQTPCTIEAKTSKALDCYRQRGIKIIEIMAKNHRALVRAHVPLLLATGGGIYSEENTAVSSFNVPNETTAELGKGHFIWFRAMEEYGMKPMAALMSATRNIAKAYRIDRDLGTLEPGKLADLLVLDRNPLEKSENYRSIDLVMKEGRVVDRAALPTRRLVTADHMA